MKQYAIMLTKNNVENVVKSLFGYQNKPELFMEDYGYMLEAHDAVVLTIDKFQSTGDQIVSYVVPLGMFHANAMCDKLNDQTFELVTQRS